MISREELPEIQKTYTDTCPQMEAVALWEHELMIDKIYDSIGSCSECIHHEVVTVTVNGVQYEDEIACTRGSFDPVDPNFFCADFERIIK